MTIRKERLESARRVLIEAEAELSKWELDKNHSSWALIETEGGATLYRPPGLLETVDDPQHKAAVLKAYRTALRSITADRNVERVVADFGARIPLAQAFVREARRDAAEEAARWMMFVVAFAVADPHCQMVPAREIVEKWEEIEGARSKAMALPPFKARGGYLFGLEVLSAILAPPDDPIVERRRNRPPASKDYKGRGTPDDSAYTHARAVGARVRGEARRVFGRAAGVVADAFVTAATGIPFGRDDARLRKRLR